MKEKMKEEVEDEKNGSLFEVSCHACAGRPGHLSRQFRLRRHNLRMTTKQELPDDALSAMATEWRRKALEGELHARGIAHELETELRRRVGAPSTNYDTLDLRPLATRTAQRRWWQLWRARGRR